MACIANGHVADFVEKERAAVGLFEFAEMVGGSAGEGAFFVAEEFGFDQFGGNGGAVECDECVFAARRFFVDRARDQFLAGAGFAEDADAGFAGGDAIDLGEELGHGRAGADKFVLAETVRSSRFSSSSRESLRAFSTVTSSLSVESGFSRKSSAPSRVALTAISMLAWPEIRTIGVCMPAFFQFFEEFDAGFSGHDDVGKDEVEMLGLRTSSSGAGRIVADGGFVTSEAERARERGQRVGVVVDEQEVGFARHVVLFCELPKRIRSGDF